MAWHRQRFSTSGGKLSLAYKTLLTAVTFLITGHTVAPHDPPGECGSMAFFLFKISPQKTHPRSQMAQNLFKLSRTDTARLYNPLTRLPNFCVNELLYFTYKFVKSNIIGVILFGKEVRNYLLQLLLFLEDYLLQKILQNILLPQ